MTDTDQTARDKYIEDFNDLDAPRNPEVDIVQESTNAVVRGWQRVVRFFDRSTRSE